MDRRCRRPDLWRFEQYFGTTAPSEFDLIASPLMQGACKTPDDPFETRCCARARAPSTRCSPSARAGTRLAHHCRRLVTPSVGETCCSQSFAAVSRRVAFRMARGRDWDTTRRPDERCARDCIHSRRAATVPTAHQHEEATPHRRHHLSQGLTGCRDVRALPPARTCSARSAALNRRASTVCGARISSAPWVGGGHDTLVPACARSSTRSGAP